MDSPTGREIELQAALAEVQDARRKAEEIAAGAEAENARLREIVDRLPKTRDGKTPLPGDVIYYSDLTEFHVYSICDSGWEEADECFLHSSEAYFTREAAEKARNQC